MQSWAVNRRSHGCGEHESGSGYRPTSLLILIRVVRDEGKRASSRHDDRSPAPVPIRLDKLKFAFDGLHCVCDREPFSLEVDIRPYEAEGLALAQSESNHDGVLVAFHRVKKSAGPARE